MTHQIRWTSNKIALRLGLIEPLAYRRQHPLPNFRLTTLPHPEDDPPIGRDVDDSGWDVVEPETYWLGWRTNFVLRTTFEVPSDWPDDVPVGLYLPIGKPNDFSHPEALAYIDGVSCATADRHHQEFLLPAEFRTGQTHQLALHGWTGLEGWFRNTPNTKLFMKQCTVVQIDQPTRDFIATARVALGIADVLDGNEPARGRIYTALDKAFKRLDTGEPLGDDAFYDSVPEAHAILKAGLDAAGPPLDLQITASGHAHIDVAWLWTLGQTRRKTGRTFHTVLRLMEQFPDYHFTQSQPQLYAYISENYPQLIDGIKARAAEGRWEPIGGMWVEADCNVSGGEGLARQFLLGRAYFKEFFGEAIDSPILWLPDVFGYAWNLPQLIKEAGLEYFFTIKISWSQYNRMPYDSFWWQGLDGTKVLTHFSTTQHGGTVAGGEHKPSTYNASASPAEVMSTWTNLQHKDVQKNMLMSYGYGDGGGGPTREMLENIREMSSFPAAPQVNPGRAIDFYRELEASAGDQLPTWNGELYLEYHRGTYTSQAANKKGNRKGEFLLHDAEFLASWAAQMTDFEYPHAELTKAWQLLCLNQFHDILPGSSIPEVYVDSDKDYATIQGMGQAIRDRALEGLGDALADGPAVIAANPTSFGGTQIGFLADRFAEGQGLLAATQAVDGGVLVEVELDPYGLQKLDITQAPSSQTRSDLSIRQDGAQFVLENSSLRALFDAQGDLVSLFDKDAGREALAEGAVGNAFQAFEDRPMFWDAWDVDIYYDDNQFAAEPAHEITILEEGPLRVALKIERKLMRSTIVQTITLTKGSKRLDFDTWVDWQERHVMLKVAFPVDVLSPAATYDIQWGNTERPTHRNTSWDWARFETCAQKWVDLSEGNFGVSLLNDCKYGHDIRDNVMRITLLRSPTYPDPDADRGEHRFTYSVFPHTGDWRNGTAAAAYALNDPIILRKVNGGRGQSLPASFVSVDAPNVIIETVKQAEDGNGLIVRLYENERNRGLVTLTAGFDIAEATRCNILEEAQEPLAVSGNTVQVPIRPYQIVTLRLTPGL